MTRFSTVLALGILVAGLVLASGLYARHRRRADLARQTEALCNSCHRIPAPGSMTVEEWDYGLSYMALFLGQELGRGEEKLSYQALHSPAMVSALRGTEQFMTEMGTIPDRPAVSDALWRQMRGQLLERARDAAPPAPAPRRTFPAARFHAVTGQLATGAIPSLLQIDGRRVIAGEVGTPSRLYAVGPRGEVLDQADLPGAPAGFVPVPGGHELLLIGDFFPTFDRHPSSLWFVASGVRPTRQDLRNLPRSAQALPCDLDGDGVTDYLVAGFGLGTLVDGGLLFERGSPGGFQEQVLWPQPGVLQVQEVDLDGDGKRELLVLLAGGREGVYRLDGCPRACRATALFERDPSFGANQMVVADLDGDGRPEIVLVNGDSLDVNLFGAIRPQHGVRVLTAGGQERFFYRMPGATNAAVADFDLDGKLDIAAVAAYPDLERQPLESFVLLRGSGPFTFEPAGHPAAGGGRWLTLAAGDVDGDGDIDLALGALRHPLGTENLTGARRAAAQATLSQPPLLILVNEARP
jgi:hypothetical protein